MGIKKHERVNGAGERNRTVVVWLETRNNCRYTTPAYSFVGLPRLELGINPPKGLVLPLHYSPPIHIFYLKSYSCKSLCDIILKYEDQG